MEEDLAWVSRVLVRWGRYPIRVGKDRSVVFQDWVVLIYT